METDIWPDSRARGFTLIEMMVSMAVLVLILGVVFSLIDQTSKVVKNTSGKIETFQAARSAFETMTRNISLATLNSYYDYVYTGTRGTSSWQPTGAYQLTSGLHFISGDGATTGLGNGTSPQQIANTHAIFFQAPLGYSQNTSYQTLDNLLNACGYFIEYGPDTPPGTNLFSASSTRYRYQLMEFFQPSEYLSVYSTPSGNAWFNGSANFTSANIHSIADNIIALVILPMNSSDNSTVLTTNYDYNSRTAGATLNVLPPLVQIIVVAIDEASALKMGNTQAEPAVISNALHGGNLFTQQANLQQDLQSLENNLNANHINYRVFQTEVALKSAKFSL